MSESRIILSEMEIDRLSKKLSMETGKSYDEARHIITSFLQETKPLGDLCNICMKNEKIKGLDYCNDCRKSFYDTCNKINHAFDSNAIKIPNAEFFERLDKQIKENDKIVYNYLYNQEHECICNKCNSKITFRATDINVIK